MRSRLAVLAALCLVACNRGAPPPAAPPSTPAPAHEAPAHGEDHVHHSFDNAERWAEVSGDTRMAARAAQQAGEKLQQEDSYIDDEKPLHAWWQAVRRIVERTSVPGNVTHGGKSTFYERIAEAAIGL